MTAGCDLRWRTRPQAARLFHLGIVDLFGQKAVALELGQHMPLALLRLDDVGDGVDSIGQLRRMQFGVIVSSASGARGSKRKRELVMREAANGTFPCLSKPSRAGGRRSDVTAVAFLRGCG